MQSKCAEWLIWLVVGRVASWYGEKVSVGESSCVSWERYVGAVGEHFRGLSPWGAGGCTIWIQIWQYIPIYPAIIPIHALLSDTLGVLWI